MQTFQFRHFLAYAAVTFRNVWPKSEFSRLCMCVCRYAKGRSPVEVQTPAHWNLIDCKMTAPPPNSFATFVSLRFSLQKDSIQSAYHKYYLFLLFKKCESMKWATSGSVCSLRTSIYKFCLFINKSHVKLLLSVMARFNKHSNSFPS
jgi:hypothetical protein